MEKLLIIGINTRGIMNSASKIDYQTYSVSYFSTEDFKPPHKEKHILNQVPNTSCGFFEDNYDCAKLLELALEYMEEVDKIILTTGISSSDFKGKYKKYKKKIVGNKNTAIVEDKYKFYKKIKNEFLTPKTFKLKYDNASEIEEIIKQYKNLSFIIKPLQGSGGYGVNFLNFHEKNQFKPRKLEEEFNYKKCDFLVQEFIEGRNISSSVLATKHKTQNIMNSIMLTEANFGAKNSFKYCGNIVPLDENILKCFGKNIKYYTKFKEDIKEYKNTAYTKVMAINEISEKLIEKFNLIGSNGVDMIFNNQNDENIHVIEINPRFQGTYECIEELLKINLLEAHIKACEGTLIDIPKVEPNKYSIKRIIYSKERVKVGNLNLRNVFDIPYKGVIVEKNQPLATIVTKKDNYNEVKNEVKEAVININRNLFEIS